MPHFVSAFPVLGAARPLGRPQICAGVEVRRTLTSHELDLSETAVVSMPAAARFIPLPSGVNVWSKGRRVTPGHRMKWWISIETKDPRHALIAAASLPFPRNPIVAPRPNFKRLPS
jgi:hypothetical protein